MKVKELIERLNALDPEARAVVRGRPWGHGFDWDWEDVTEVRAGAGRGPKSSYDSLHGLYPDQENAVVIDSE